MSFNFVQAVTSTIGSNTTTGSLATATITVSSAGDVLISLIGRTAALGPAPTYSDSKSNTWIDMLGMAPAWSDTMDGQIAFNVPAGITTLTISGTGTFLSSAAWIIAEYTPSGACSIFRGLDYTAVGTLVAAIAAGQQANGTDLQSLTVVAFGLNTATATVPWTISTGTIHSTAKFSTTVSLVMADTTYTPAVGTTLYEALLTASGTVTTGTLYEWMLVAPTLLPPAVNVGFWNGSAVPTPSIAGVPIVDVHDWLGTAVTSNAGVPITTNTGTVTATVVGGTIATVTGTVAAVTTASTVGTVTSTLPVNVVQWNGSAPNNLTQGMVPAVFPVFSGTATGGGANILTFTGATGGGTGNSFYNGQGIAIIAGTGSGQARMIVAYTGSTATCTATVAPAWQTNPGTNSVFVIFSNPGMDVETWLGSPTAGFAAAGGTNYPSVDVEYWNQNAALHDVNHLPQISVTNWLGTMVATPNIGGVPKVDVTDWLGTAVTSAAGVPITTNTGTVTATVIGGTIATVTNPVSISTSQIYVKKNTALEFSFPMFGTSGLTLLSGLGTSVVTQVSIDGGAVAATTNTASEIGSGLYKIQLQSTELNGTNVSLILTASGAASDVVTFITQP